MTRLLLSWCRNARFAAIRWLAFDDAVVVNLRQPPDGKRHDVFVAENQWAAIIDCDSVTVNANFLKRPS